MRTYTELYEILSALQSDRNVQKMKRYIQHGRISTYEHCENVAKLSYTIDREFSLRRYYCSARCCTIFTFMTGTARITERIVCTASGTQGRPTQTQRNIFR